MADLGHDTDVLIVGAGPAGLAAAALLAQKGVGRVIVVDREAQAGGVPRHCRHSPYGLREFRRMMTGPSYAKALVERAKAAGVEIFTGINVTRLLPGPTAEITSDAGPDTIHARAVLLATGARETTRAERLIGGTKPQGVLSTGALQLLLDAGRKPFLGPAILGTELVAFSALLSCRLAGIRPVAMIEPLKQPTARWPAQLFPMIQGIPLLTGTCIDQINGQTCVTGLRLNNGRELQADGLIVSGKFQPDAPLLAGSDIRIDPATGGPEIDQYGRCSAHGYFAAGNLLRAVETAGWSWSEGQKIGTAIHAFLHGDLPSDAGLRIARSGPIAFMVPQRIALGPKLGLDSLQLRVGAPVTGTLTLRSAETTMTSKTLRSRSERRILMPLPSAGRQTHVQLSPRGAA